MKRLFLLVALAAATLSLSAQRKMQVWEGPLYSEFATTVVDSVTFLASPTGTLKPTGIVHDTITKEVVKEVHDTLYIDTCQDDDSVVSVSVFSVSADKQIRFSPGNLQCSGVTSSNYVWSFAENQYDMLGTANVSGGNLADKIDLFGWSSTGSATWGISTSTNDADYSVDFVDWGTNTIGTDEPNTWRTLTNDEWTYLRNNRTNADKLIGVARIKLNDDGTDYVNGLILLPDGWKCPEGVTFESGLSSTNSYADKNLYTTAEWQQLEAAGAVFLPASGDRSIGPAVYDLQNFGFYWSATPYETVAAYNFYFSSGRATYGFKSLYFGLAVRLVQDVEDDQDVTYTITLNTSVENGTIKADKTEAAEGETITLTVTPDADYTLKTLTVLQGVDTLSTTAVNDTTYTFTMPASAVTVTATFLQTYAISLPSTVEHGTIVADKATAIAGDTITLTVTPDAGYVLDVLTVKDAEDKDIPVTDNTFTMPASAVTITAAFKLHTYAIAFTMLEHGTIVADKTGATLGETVTLTVTPDTDYVLDVLTVKDAADNEIAVSVDNTFTMPASVVIVSATFKVQTYAITLPSTVEHGTIKADKTEAAKGETITLTVTPATGYVLDVLTVKDAANNEIEVSDSNTFTMPASAVTITATFKLQTYTITLPSSVENGTIKADKKEAAKGETVTLTVTPATGYSLKTITVVQGGTTVSTTAVNDTTYTFTMPAGAVTVRAEFKVRSAFTQAPFSVSATQRVYFSPGCLQYTQSSNTWSFAEYQYEMLGKANVSGGYLAGKIDLFGWSGSTGSAEWGISTSTEYSDYSGDFVDWGQNTIGTNAPNTYRTLTKDEWSYLFYTRTDAANKKGVARIQISETDYVNGLILLPDNWTGPAGVTFKSGFASEYSIQAYADYQTFTLADWQKLEAAGAVFLPASGYRYAGVYDVQLKGYFWSATPYNTGGAFGFFFSSGDSPYGYSERSYGRAVRLVQNVD